MKSLASRLRDLIEKLIVYFNKQALNGLPRYLEGDAKPSQHDNAIFREA